MKVIVTGGGTGGHVYPAIAIAKELLLRDPDTEVLYVGTKTGIEATIAKEEGFDFASVHVKGMPRRLNKASWIAVKELMKGLKDAKSIIREFQPDLIVGTGGYVSAPMVYKGAKMGVKTVIQEQNAFPGITNKILSKHVDLAIVAFPEAVGRLKCQDKVKVIGNPVRRTEDWPTGVDAKRALGFSSDRELIVAVGGSGGQKSINEVVKANLKNWKARGWQVLLISGKRFYEDLKEELKAQEDANFQLSAFSHRMPEVLSAADVVITSSSAMTLAEISAIGKPAILIPKAYTAEDHQLFNAKSFAERKAAYLIEEKDLTAEILDEKMTYLLNEPGQYEAMREQMVSMGNPKATEEIVDLIETLWE